MGKYTRMNPAQFAEWIKNNLHHGEFVAFALDENGNKVSSDESLAKGDVDLECWYCATIVKSEDYDFNVLLINYAGGGQPYAIEIEDDLPEMLDIYFNTVNDFYDNAEDNILLTKLLKADIRDMEGAAILQACYSNQLYCLCYKVISDMYGSGSTMEQYQKNLEKCLNKIGEKITGIIQKVGGEK